MHIFFLLLQHIHNYWIMAKNLLNKYVWLVETIYKAKRITFEEINGKWLDNELPLRTFHKWRIAVEEMFGLLIECDRKGGYHYYIANEEELKDGNLRNWLLNTISVSNLLIDNLHMKDRILLEEIPSGQAYLSSIIEAMKKKQPLRMTYQSYWSDKSSTFEVEPFCVKLFKQRWYMVGRSPYYGDVLIYALDRIHALSIFADKKFKMPDTFHPSQYFENFYGVIIDEDYEAEVIKLKVSTKQANYWRSLPLHHSQQEIERTKDYSIFELRLCPTYDFLQEILRNGEDVEVLEPLWLRDEIASKIKGMWDKYQL